MDKNYQDPTDYTNTQKNHSESLEGDKTNLASDSHNKKEHICFLMGRGISQLLRPFLKLV